MEESKKPAEHKAIRNIDLLNKMSNKVKISNVDAMSPEMVASLKKDSQKGLLSV